MTSLVEIPFHGTTIHAINDEGKPLVSVRHVCESLGIDAASQREKLKKKTWATEVIIPSVGTDGRTRQMHMVDRRTLTMWLATIDTNRVKPDARPLLIAFQNEAADALDSYFHEGGAVNPRATEEQLGVLEQKTRFQMEMINLARGAILDEQFLESKARIVLARALGEEPEIAPLDVPLYAESYLREKKLPAKDIKSLRSVFGMRLSKSYKELHGAAPKKAENEVNGGIRKVNSYTESDRPLFDRVWEQHYADLYEPSLMQELEND